MNYYTVADLARSFRTVRKNTIILAEEIPEESYAFRASPDVRSVAEMLAHIAVTPRFQRRLHSERSTFVDLAGFAAALERMAAEEASLKTKAQIVEVLRREGDEFAAWLEGLPEATLGERVNFPPPVDPPSRTRFDMLQALKEHEMHHRAQLMLIERMLGIVPHLTRERLASVARMQQQQAHKQGS
jgi:uncharacterized damage-inducible protein DinB